MLEHRGKCYGDGDGLLYIHLPLWANSVRALGSKEGYRHCPNFHRDEEWTAQSGKVSEECIASILKAETLFAAYSLLPFLAWFTLGSEHETSWGFIPNYKALQPRRSQYSPATAVETNPAPTAMIQHFPLRSPSMLKSRTPGPTLQS